MARSTKVGLAYSVRVSDTVDRRSTGRRCLNMVRALCCRIAR